LMAIIMVMASSKKVMGQFVISRHLAAMGWLATSVMLCACIGLFVAWK
jgi:Mn2+/Fe2+ NRAMP family transporter